MTTSHKPCLTTRRTCPFCGEDFIEHDTSTDRIGTLGSIYIDGVHYIVPVKVVEFYKRAKGENVRLDQTDGKREAGHIRALLMLWQGLVNLSSSGTSAEAEVNALLVQIESTLSAEQIKLINEMKLTQTDTQAWAQENGITLGTGTGTGTGTGQGQGSNLTAEEKATRQAANNPTGDSSNRENSLSNALSKALIENLENKIK